MCLLSVEVNAIIAILDSKKRHEHVIRVNFIVLQLLLCQSLPLRHGLAGVALVKGEG